MKCLFYTRRKYPSVSAQSPIFTIRVIAFALSGVSITPGICQLKQLRDNLFAIKSSQKPANLLWLSR